jgi:GT2 family glycosyltransferase
MAQQKMEVCSKRFYLNDPHRYSVYGIIPDGYEVEAYLAGVQLPLGVTERMPRSAIERYNEGEAIGGRRVELLIDLPKKLPAHKSLKIYGVQEGQRTLWYRLWTSELMREQGNPQYNIEEERIDQKEGICSLRGWAVADSHVEIYLFDEKKKRIPCKIKRNNRIDVVDMFHECPVEEANGFFVDLKGIRGRYLYLVMRTEDGRKTVHRVGLGSLQVLESKAEKYGKKGMDYLRGHGVRALTRKVWNKFSGSDERSIDYGKWLAHHLPTEEELVSQRQETFPYMPKISIVVPLYKTKPEYLKEMIESVQNQTYANWELCLSDGSGENSPIESLLQRYESEEPRIRVIYNRRQLRISENTNEAIKACTGEFVAFMDHDDVLPAHALYECVKAVNEHPETEVIYSDEDKTSLFGNRYFDPHFKPDFNIDLLCSVNYISHFFVVKRTLQEKVGMLRPEFDGSQDYDFILRCVEATGHICHIPKVLYHWRCHEESTAENPQSKLYAFEAGKRAIQAHYDRIGVQAEVSMGEQLGLYRTHFIRPQDPLVSILIPNMDHVDDLERCITSIVENSSYRNFECIVIENNSREEATFAFYRELEERYPQVRVERYEGSFNFSDINNFGAAKAKGEYLLLLNNDTKIINADWLEELLGYGMRKDVGIVGARLYYGDDTIQHAGVILGLGGMAGHAFVQYPKYNPGYFCRIITAQDLSAVTAACMLVRRQVYEEVGGLSVDLAVAFNDIDFCLKVRNAGYLVVYNPYVELYHYESKSRGLEDTPEKLERFQKEIAVLEEHWPDVFKKPDPYYNPNLTLKRSDYGLRKIWAGR